MQRLRPCILMAWLLASLAHGLQAVELEVPKRATAGSDVVISTTGSGQGTLYVVGPNHLAKQRVKLGATTTLDGRDFADAGRYLFIVRSDDGDATATLYVLAADPARLSFVAHPSRAPAAQPKSITAAVYPFDRYENLILKPLPVTFRLSMGGGAPIARTVTTQNGAAYTALDSGPRVGRALFQAFAGSVSALRVVQLVASEACSLRISAHATAQGIDVQSEPIRDCAGNLVPDGTVVTFTMSDEHSRSTVDTAVSRGVAKAIFPASKAGLISAAAGLALGNQIPWRENR